MTYQHKLDYILIEVIYKDAEIVVYEFRGEKSKMSREFFDKYYRYVRG